MSIIVILFIGAIGFGLVYRQYQKPWKKPKSPFPIEWRKILSEKVNFYNALNSAEKLHFENRVHEFLLNYRVTGVSVTIQTEDRVLTAASAIIPIFRFPAWKYSNLVEVLIYPDHFDEQFNTDGEGRRILGMVGTGYMEGKMILSQRALRQGFENATDKRNTAVHEFIHLIDKMDGNIDGIPAVLLNNQSSIPWISLIQEKMDEIHADDSDIDPYAGTSQSEFLPVVSEYFFERPKLLADKHPRLYEALEQFFRHEMDQRSLLVRRQSIRRNSPCPCGSGEKFKHCCLKD